MLLWTKQRVQGNREFFWLNAPAWDNKAWTKGPIVLLVFQTLLGNAELGVQQRAVFLGSTPLQGPLLSSLYPGSTGAIGEIRIAALVVKYLDRSKTNNCESISQECFH
jgi:hypothetical protein